MFEEKFMYIGGAVAPEGPRFDYTKFVVRERDKAK